MIRSSRSFRRLLFAVAAVALTAGASASSTSVQALRRVSQLTAGTAPAAVPTDYVITPMGYFPAECVHEVRSTDRVLGALRVQHLDGSMTQQAECARPHFTRQGQRIDSVAQMRVNTLAQMRARQRAGSGPSAEPASNGGYYAEVSYINGNTGTRKLTAKFPVPKAPSTVHGQVVFFFPGLVQTNPEDTILQPVLSWDNFGVARWQYVSWNCCGDSGSGTANYSTPIDVNVGDALYGEMSSNCPVGSATCKSYSIISRDLTTGQASILDTGAPGVTGTEGQVDNWIVGAALEPYGVTACTDFPASGSLRFSNIKATDPNGNAITPVWRDDNALLVNAPDCNVTTNWNNTTNWIYY